MVNNLKRLLGEFSRVFRATKKSQWTSARYFFQILGDPARFIKLFDPVIWRIILSYAWNPPGFPLGMKVGRFFNSTTKSVIFVVVVSLLYRIKNRTMVERKSLLITLFPIPMNSIGSKNDPGEDAVVSSHINRFVLSLLSLQKEKISQRSFPNQKERHQKSSMPKSNRLSRWCKNWMRKKRNSIQFKGSSNQSLTEQAELESNPLPKEIEQFLQSPTRPGPSFLSDGWLELHLGSNPTEKSTRDQKLLKKEHDFSDIRRSESTDIVKLFKIILYLQNTVSIHPISSDQGCKFHEIADLLVLSITEPDLVYQKGFAFFFLNEVAKYGDPLIKKSLLVLPPIFYEENESFYRRIRTKWFPSACGNRLEEPKRKIVVFATNKIREAVNQYGLIRNLIELQYSTYSSLRNALNRFFLLIGKDTLNHRIPMKDTINRHLSNLKKSQTKWFNPLLLSAPMERYVNRDPDVYRYKWSTWFEEHIVSEQKSYFQDRFKFSFGFSKLLRFLFMSFSPIQGRQRVSGNKFKPFFLDDDQPCQKISKDMIASFHTRDIWGENFVKLDYDLSPVLADPYNWLHPVKPFHRSSLISAFYKANRLQFMNNSHHSFFYCPQKFPFYVFKAPMDNYDFIYRQFLNPVFIRNTKFAFGVGQTKHAFSHKDLLALIKKTFSKNVYYEPDGVDKSFDFLTANPGSRETSYSIIDISGTPLTEEQIENLKRTYCQPRSDINLADSEETNFYESLADMNLADSEETNFDESLSDDLSEYPSYINLVGSQKKKLDEFLADMNLADSEETNFDESLADMNLADSEETNFDEFLADMNLADSEETNFDEFLADINLADSEETNFDEFLADMNLADSEETNFYESIADINLADSEETNLDESLADINLADSEETNLDESLADMNLADSEETNFELSINFNTKSLLIPSSKNLLIPSSSFKKFFALELEKRKKDRRRRNKHDRLKQEKIRGLYLRLCYKKRRMERNKRLARAFATRSKGNLFQKYLSKTKWKLFKRYLPWALTSTGFRYLTFLFLDIVSDLWPRMMKESGIYVRKMKVRILRWTKESAGKWTELKNKWITSWITSKTFTKWAPKVQKFEEKRLGLRRKLKWIKTACEKARDVVHRATFHRNDLPLIATERSKRNLWEFWILMDLLSLVVFSFLFLFLVQFVETFFFLLRDFKRAHSFLLNESMIEMELEELLADYPPSPPTDFGLSVQNFFIGLLDKMLFHEPLPLKKKSNFLNMTLSHIIKNLSHIIKNIRNQIIFQIRIRSVSHTSRELYSFLRSRKKAGSHLNTIAHWISNTDWVEDPERDVLMQFATLSRKTSISEILWSLTQSDDRLFLLKDDLLPEIIEQPGEAYLRKVIDFHQKDLLNYEFNPSSLAEKRIFLALYHIMNYSKTSSGVDPFPSLSRQKPFSLRLNLAPSKSILLIGTLGLGRSYLVNYLAKNSYLPLITIFLHKFRGTIYRFDEELFDNEDYYDPDLEEFEVLIESRSEPEMLSEDMQALDYSYSYNWRFFLNFYNDYINLLYDFDADVDRQIDQVSIDDDQTDDMDTILYVAVFYVSLQLELAKAMSPCITWIPNIHEMDFESDFFSVGLLAHLLSWDCERSASNNNLVIASTHMPEKMQPSLIDTHRFNTCIKVGQPHISQQRKHLCTLAYTRGFRLEREIFHTTHGFESITLGSNAHDLVGLTNEALSISLSQGKSIIDSNTLRYALHRQTWNLQDRVRPINNSRILFYQIGRVVGHYLLLRDCPIDPISIYMNKELYQERESYLYRWYYQLGMSIKKLTILIYLLNCSAGWVAQDLWSRSGLDANNAIALGRLAENHSDLVHGLLEVEGVLEGFLPTEKDCRQFDKDQTPVLRRPEPRHPADMIQNGFWSMIDQKLIYQQDPLASPIFMGGMKVDLQVMFADFIVWSPRIWSPWGFLLDAIERFHPNELGFPTWNKSFFFDQVASLIFDYDEDASNLDPTDLQPESSSPSVQDEFEEFEEKHESFLDKEKKKPRPEFYKLDAEEVEALAATMFDTRMTFFTDGASSEEISEAFAKLCVRTRARINSSKEHKFFRISRFIWDPGNPFVSIFEDSFMATVLETRELFTELNKENRFFPGEIKSIKRNLFLWDKDEVHYEWLIQQNRWLSRSNKPVAKGSFRSTALSESYQYLSKLFLSNRTVVNQMQKLLVRKRWLFSDDMQHFFNEQFHPAEARKN